MTIAEKLQNFVLSGKDHLPFSGSILVQEGQNTHYKEGFGYANRSEKLQITPSTKFGMASGCKIFTSLSISQLVQAGRLSFNTRLKDVLIAPFPHFHPDITIHQLLTHTSGIPDYFDEEIMDDFEELWKQVPMYSIKTPKDFLPMFQQEKMKFTPGSSFAYNNAGYILLGLVVEEISGQAFPEYVQKHIFNVCEMTDSGYYRMDQLPEHTALGYIDNVEMDTWKTNIYSVPIIGGSDGGAFTSVIDLVKFWDGLMNGKLLNKTFLDQILCPHVESGEEMAYGYGIWISKEKGEISKYLLFGYDPGVRMHSSFHVKTKIQTHILSNIEQSVYPIGSYVDELFADIKAHQNL
ncbi:beta-lactamase [Fictibacillus macauensis ZFHKF-1]|uniref:Beta-lactamase n=1 Tax=Fictibacillus macauensis ZFHKF-1 TaxID=1196324 RepID=I8UAR7_9BACL|nr:serine hydrolase [Fictibacillus macauensis]EIT84010.1 beta-lactamase [Fictibacillus macauensis ZFHKF-1]